MLPAAKGPLGPWPPYTYTPVHAREKSLKNLPPGETSSGSVNDGKAASATTTSRSNERFPYRRSARLSIASRFRHLQINWLPRHLRINCPPGGKFSILYEVPLRSPVVWFWYHARGCPVPRS